MSFFDRDYRWISFSLLLVSSVAQACGVSILAAVPLDMAPRYAGLLTGMFMSVANLVSVSGPPIVSVLTPTGSYPEWQAVLIMVGAVNILNGLVFAIFGSASIQPWARSQRKSMAEVVSPFVTMGRRMSTFMDRPPITPITTLPGGGNPTGGSDFAFKLDVEANSSELKNGRANSFTSDDDEEEEEEEKEEEVSGTFFGDAGGIPLKYIDADEGRDLVASGGMDNEAFNDEVGGGVVRAATRSEEGGIHGSETATVHCDNDAVDAGDDDDETDRSEDSDDDGEEEEKSHIDNEGENETKNENDYKRNKRKRAFSEFGLEVSRLPVDLNLLPQNEMASELSKEDRRRKVPVFDRPVEMSRQTDTEKMVEQLPNESDSQYSNETQENGKLEDSTGNSEHVNNHQFGQDFSTNGEIPIRKMGEQDGIVDNGLCTTQIISIRL
ncbi:hypothetical protein EGW08_011460 [Elysia chlorotica]|uniref:Major facilitator superfamily (MFS) profile domain-containing protein n=1 Tax=Elysia chlorotica TaxID=188477 RepID=A0A433TGT9_ELYCH|nr:hypothetical protein EGW08_011460 [Elysia chlorotica]